jgi:hypothetical protein
VLSTIVFGAVVALYRFCPIVQGSLFCFFAPADETLAWPCFDSPYSAIVLATVVSGGTIVSVSAGFMAASFVIAVLTVEFVWLFVSSGLRTLGSCLGTVGLGISVFRIAVWRTIFIFFIALLIVKSWETLLR